MKDKCYGFNGYEQKNNVCLVYLEAKLHQDRCSWCIYKSKKQKMVELRYSETNKELQTYRWSF